MKAMMRKANKLGAKYALILGETEQENNQVTIKNMVTAAKSALPKRKQSNIYSNKKQEPASSRFYTFMIRI